MSEFCPWCEEDSAYESDNGEVDDDFEKLVNDALEKVDINIGVERGWYEDVTCEHCGTVTRFYHLAVEVTHFIKKGKEDLRVQ